MVYPFVANMQSFLLKYSDVFNTVLCVTIFTIFIDGVVKISQTIIKIRHLCTLAVPKLILPNFGKLLK